MSLRENAINAHKARQKRTQENHRKLHEAATNQLRKTALEPLAERFGFHLANCDVEWLLKPNGEAQDNGDIALLRTEGLTLTATRTVHGPALKHHNTVLNCLADLGAALVRREPQDVDWSALDD